jgi:DNA-binding SARP family transcriptional activator
VDFAVLGPLRCTAGGVDVTPQRRREVAVLGALLVEPGAAQSAEALAAAVWHGAPPDSWPKALQMHVVRLREAIGRSQVETTASGYRLTAPAESVDASVFATDVAALLAAGPLDTDADERITGLLGRWRGEPFEELGAWPPAVFARDRLRELRADALDARGASRLARGVASIAELTDLVNEDPLRESRWALLMTALYRGGRQTEALQAFQRARKTLTVEFGVDPGPELTALERAILDHDPRLDNRAAGEPIEFQRRGRELFEAGDREGAVTTLEHAITAARERNADPRSIAEACVDLAEYTRARGDWPHANEAIADAVRLARGLDDPVLLARAALVAAGDGWITGLDPASSPVALLEESLARLPNTPSALRSRLHARLAVAASGSRAAEVMADSEEALRLAEILDDSATLAVALHSRLVVDLDIAHLEQRQRCGSRLLRLADTAAMPLWRAWALPAQARVEAMRGNLALADEHFAELERLGEELDNPVARYHAAYGDVLRSTVRSDYAAALRAIDRARDAGVLAMPDPTGPALGHYGSLGIIQLLQGTVPASTAPMETQFPTPSMDATYRAYFAAVAAQRGDLDDAAAAIGHLDSATLVALPRDAYWPSLVWLLSTALDGLGDRDRAAVVYELAVPFADTTVVDLGATYLGAMAQHLGVLAAASGDNDRAADHFRAALAAHERWGADAWAAKSQAALERLRPSSSLRHRPGPQPDT